MSSPYLTVYEYCIRTILYYILIVTLFIFIVSYLTVFQKVFTPKACTYASIFPSLNHMSAYNRPSDLSMDGIIGIATPYKIIGSEFKLRWGQEVLSSPRPSRESLGFTNRPLPSGYRSSLPGIKMSGCGFDHSPQRNGEAKNA